ncbi:hypothetical protein H0H81_012201 [Sphagnurus paluster]|uniref:glucan endo-1,3-beta-D-glucosidase n=1 Tax=Sphagnurus paluster TaxID=117069 RepID=A0A9P7GGY5_9AGAR|nr:hypothetical protein H0H81_012201 [Sphagnurus paluster]
MDWFLRDIVNPSKNDPYFTVTRCRDWFAGHLWASGIANGAGPRDQESIGEAVNGYYGALLWADVTGNTDIKNYARLLIANEQHAAQIYWHLYPKDSSTDREQPYPKQGLRNLVTMGNVMDWQSGAWLFWGSQKVQIAAIQILPLTPINEIHANAAAAAQRPSSLTTWGTGNSFSNQLYFISTRPAASNFITLNLVTSTTDRGQAAKFKFTFAPNAGTIQPVSSNKFVTADQSGSFAISAARDVSSSWEVFVVRPKQGAASGIYSILASSNEKYVTLGSGNALINNGETEANSAAFRLFAT